MSVLAPGIGPFGVPELIIIAFIIILIFGVGRLPGVGGAVGKSIREFRKATKDGGDEERTDTTDRSASDEGASVGSVAATEDIFCGECGTKNPRSAKFCSQCGHTMTAPVG